MKPIVKAVGGKTRLLDELVARVPSTYGCYYEPFVGGGALFFHLAPKRAVISDMNRDLIVVYTAVRDDVEGVISKLERHRVQHNKGYYYEMREWWNRSRQCWTPAARAAMYLYLNRSCFNGLWRVNSDGQFNVPMGTYARLSLPSPELLRKAHQTLTDVTILHEDFRCVAERAQRGDFIYLDPPYVPLSTTSNFTTYTADGFTLDDHRELAATARSLVGRGVHVMLSNSDVPFVRDLYKGFTINTVRCNRAINSKAGGRGGVDEVIIVA